MDSWVIMIAEKKLIDAPETFNVDHDKAFLIGALRSALHGPLVSIWVICKEAENHFKMQ